MSCSGDRELCRETYFLVYMGVLVAAFPADMSKEPPEGQLGWMEKCGSGRVGVPLAHQPPPGCSSVHYYSSLGFKGSPIFSWMILLSKTSAEAEVSSPPLGLCRLLVAGALAQFHLVLPSLTTVSPHMMALGVSGPFNLMKVFSSLSHRGPPIFVSFLTHGASRPWGWQPQMGTNTSQGAQR